MQLCNSATITTTGALVSKTTFDAFRQDVQELDVSKCKTSSLILCGTSGNNT
ncbi:MAG: hypothetical protein JO327_10755 [Nitrososphaeraceae archaeon]|nr:hypothetical protein [Nitrososphaeraceae archaeon]MBV9668593.1 hypothetical protein [Nitrososphaeraceae archaeon]